MFWRKRTNEEEIDELQGFVDGMKRGQTLPTGDSLLETLRQIHDRRETPVVGHDHKRMLAERLRREMRVRSGQAVDDTVRVPDFAPAPARRRFLEWAVAASLVFHVGLGVLVLEHVHFGRIFGVSANSEISSAQSDYREYEINWLPPPPPIVTNRSDSRQNPTIGAQPSIGHAGQGREGAVGTTGAAGASVPSASSAPVGPPVAPTGPAPIVAGYNSAGIEGPADRGIAESAGPSLGAPPVIEPPSTTSTEVGAVRFSISDDFDVKPKVLFKPKPFYPARAQEAKVKGTVRVSAVFAADGTIREINVVGSLGWGLDEEAINAVRRIKFTPATKGGVPVSVRITVNVDFGLL